MLSSTSTPQMAVPKINILIPMAGAGSRFAKAGYKDPKPLIPVRGKPMIQVVVDNMRVPDAHFIFVVQREHYAQYDLGRKLSAIAPGCDIVQIDGLTEGAACTVLKAKSLIDSDVPLLTANSDQFLEWDAAEFVASMTDGVDGVVSTFIKDEPDVKWSYAKLDEYGHIQDIQEKKPISNIATTGIYMWRKGSDFVRYAQQMMDAGDKSNGEYYVAPVYNYGIRDGKKYITKHCDRMWGIGVPDDLNFFLAEYKKPLIRPQIVDGTAVF
ncbi:phosphatase/phosphohexomutase [Spizellomyces punctatus DAOM BR117]|uniref:Phosphatase/phosphohexomutase n=1 Tax=Spizellomyces punctatus (strain DAOM BR117) TaxID=645134 RepID=A0A0L0H5Z5_SPIPD|nr:phosphatase/phosphohexomutase [Spizellomyces punctatus DAOM BR117]KNC96622.1 phosphatase/phosphohexomutase [Spizellomyces punctatus DAOM BR117]|eukprot:XP_016604662.1 phosphatase/phosphohexomutase [Spizellomyces punctatus DAOM BR117]